jgi:sugar phosphate isomerase/epimerase
MGFRGLQFDAGGKGFSPVELSESGRREFLRLLAGENQKLAGLRVDLGAKGLGAGVDLDRLLSRMDKIISAAGLLRSGLVCVEVGRLPEPPADVKPPVAINREMAGLLILPEPVAPAPEPAPVVKSPADVEAESAVGAALAELARLADRHGVALAFGSSLSSFAALEWVLNSARCPWFGVDLDPVAILHDRWSSDEIFSRLAHSIRHVRARDAEVGAGGRTHPAAVGSGDVDWRALIGNLENSNYRGFVTADPSELANPRASLIAAVDCLKPLLRGTGV